MTKVILPKKQSDILLWIVENGPSKEYDLAKNKVANSFIAHKAPKILEKKGYLRSIQIGKAKNGYPIRLFIPTFKGILAYCLISRLRGIETPWPVHKEFCTPEWIERNVEETPFCFGKADMTCVLAPPICPHMDCCVDKLWETLKELARTEKENSGE